MKKNINTTSKYITSSDKDKIVETAQQNLKTILSVNEINQPQLLNDISTYTGYTISQGNLSKIINSNVGYSSIFNILLICQTLGIDFKEICWKKLTDEEAYNYNKQVHKVIPIIDETVQLKDVTPYLGDYHCYFYPTLSDEAQRGDIHYAILHTSYDPKGKVCNAKFIMYPNAVSATPSNIEKRYNGRLIVADSIHSCYIILKNEENGEISVLNFRKITTSTQAMDCCIAGVLTVCAGQGRNATTQRMVLSQRQLSPKGIEIIRPHLLMNSKKIYISKAKLKKFIESYHITDQARRILSSCVEADEYCCVREEPLWACDDEKNNLIKELRNISIGRKYHKIGYKSDELLHDTLYRCKENDDFFI